MKARIKNLFNRIKALGVGQQEVVSLFGGLMGSGRASCSYWSQENLREYSKSHPGEKRPPGALKVLLVGCPFVGEELWGGLGSQKYDADGQPLPAAERPCAGCEYLIPKE
jgi:hypothetical protein